MVTSLDEYLILHDSLSLALQFVRRVLESWAWQFLEHIFHKVW